MQLRHIVAIGTPLTNIQKAKSKEVLLKLVFQLLMKIIAKVFLKPLVFLF